MKSWRLMFKSMNIINAVATRPQHTVDRRVWTVIQALSAFNKLFRLEATIDCMVTHTVHTNTC